MQKGDLVDHQGKLVRIVSIVDDNDVLVATGGYGSAPVLVSRAELGKRVFRPYGGGFEGEFTQTVNDNKGIVLAVIGAGAVLTGILLFSKPTAAAPTPVSSPTPQPPPSSPPSQPHSPPPSPPPTPHVTQTAQAPSPAKAPSPVPRAPSPPKAPRPPAGAPSGFPPPDVLAKLAGFVPKDSAFAPLSALTPAQLADIASARRGDLSTLESPGMGAGAGLSSSLPASVGSVVPVANIPGAGSLPASMTPSLDSAFDVLKPLNPFG
jgi:hypothetical protein